jgi:hypothetical protein
MNDLSAHLEKLRVQMAECEVIRDLAIDKGKRQMFAKLAEHYRVLAGELEREIASRSPFPDTFLGRKTQEPFPTEEK